MAKKNKNKKFWFIIAVLAVILAAPNATVIRATVDSVNPFAYNAVRFSLGAVLTLPFLLFYIRKVNSKNLKYAVLSGLFYTIATFSFVWAINLSQASYISVTTLITPLIFIILSAKIIGEKISQKAILGITLAAVGAFVVVALPIALAQNGEFVFYPLATALSLLNSISFPLTVIYTRKSNESGMPLPALMGVTTSTVATVSIVAVLLADVSLEPALEIPAFIAVAYSAIVVAIIAGLMRIWSYERIGSAVTGTLAYSENLLAIVIPIVFLGETLSIEVVVGGALILVGVYVAQHHKSKHHRHFHVLRHH